MVLPHRRIRDRGLLVNLAQRAQIIDTFLHELGHPAAVAVTLTDYRDEVLLEQPHPDFDYDASPGIDGTHYRTSTIRKGLVIDLTAYVFDEGAA